MTNHTETSQRAAGLKKGTAQLDRGGLEQALIKALDSGPNAIGQQVRYILALSQMAAVQPTTQPLPEKPLTVTQARVSVLAELAHSLNESQLKGLVKQVRQIADDTLRIQQLTRLALYVPPQNYRSLVRDLWTLTNRLPDPTARARNLFRLIPLLMLFDDEPAASTALLDVIALAQSINNTEARIRSLVALAPHLPQTLSARLLARVLDEVDKINNDNLRSNAISAISKPLPTDMQERALKSAQGIHNPMERARAITALAGHLTQDLQPRVRALALDAINAIEDEEERAEALISFSPYLEYASEAKEFPTLLARALAIAVAMTRRHIRAKVLVALAPQLTLDLQGEALAAVHSLGSERDRAMLLAALAPTLPPEMLVASLAVAHTMREQDSRVHALTVLAHHMPPQARQQTLLDALAAASNLPHHYERVTALIALLDILPDQLREQAYTNALETTRLIENENARSRALSLLGPNLPQNLLLRALDVAYELADIQQRMSALIGIAPYLAETDQQNALAHLLECTREITFDYKRTRALTSIAPLLTQELLEDALAMADSLEEPYDRVTAYIALAQNLPPERRPSVLSTAWELVKDIDDGYDRASALAAIAPFLPPSARSELARTAGMVLGAIMDEYDQASAISILAPILAESGEMTTSGALDSYSAVREGVQVALSVPQQSQRVELLAEGAVHWIEIADPDRQYMLWRQTAQHLATLPLADTLLCLGALLPVIQSLAGDESTNEIIRILGPF